jgi:hypothetical protein
MNINISIRYLLCSLNNRSLLIYLISIPVLILLLGGCERRNNSGNYISNSRLEIQTWRECISNNTFYSISAFAHTSIYFGNNGRFRSQRIDNDGSINKPIVGDWRVIETIYGDYKLKRDYDFGQKGVFNPSSDEMEIRNCNELIYRGIVYTTR